MTSSPSVRVVVLPDSLVYARYERMAPTIDSRQVTVYTFTVDENIILPRNVELDTGSSTTNKAILSYICRCLACCDSATGQALVAPSFGGNSYVGITICSSSKQTTNVTRYDEPDTRGISATGPAFETAFQEYMANWRLDGKPRTARRYSTYTNCPLPTAHDRSLFIQIYVKTNPLQVAHGLMFDLPQGKTNQWIHVLLPVLRAAFRALGDAPSRSLVALGQRLALMEERELDETAEEMNPLFVTTEPNDVSWCQTLSHPQRPYSPFQGRCTRYGC